MVLFVKLLSQKSVVILHCEISIKIIMLKIRTIIAAVLILIISVSCNGGVKQEKSMENKGKALVVFFSHAGDNYAVGNIEGPTRHSSTLPRRRPARASCHPMKAKSPTCHNMTPSSLVAPCGGAPIHR